MIRTLFASIAFLFTPGFLLAGDAVLVQDGKAKAAIFVSARVMDDAMKAPEPASVWTSLKTEDNRRRLRESVRDLAAILERVSGVAVPIVVGPPPKGDTRLPILIGELAAKVRQAREAVPLRTGLPDRRLRDRRRSSRRIGSWPRATRFTRYSINSAAVGTFPARWGRCCQHFPIEDSAAGLEYRPRRQSTAACGTATTTSADAIAWAVLAISAGHNIEFAVPKELRTKHPEIRAIIGGKPHDHLIKWTHPLVAEALSDACLDALKKDPETQDVFAVAGRRSDLGRV